MRPPKVVFPFPWGTLVGEELGAEADLASFWSAGARRRFGIFVSGLPPSTLAVAREKQKRRRAAALHRGVPQESRGDELLAMVQAAVIDGDRELVLIEMSAKRILPRS